jgi:hypothetical protein
MFCPFLLLFPLPVVVRFELARLERKSEKAKLFLLQERSKGEEYDDCRVVRDVRKRRRSGVGRMLYEEVEMGLK